MIRIDKNRIVLSILAVFIAFCSLFETGAVYAAETQTAAYEAKIEVSFPQYGGTASIKEKADKSSPYPSPKITKPSVTVGDKQSGAFVIGYDEPGTYQYTVTQTTAKKITGVTYENTVYNVTLFVASKEDGTLYHELAVFKGDSIKKAEKLTFTNTKKKNTNNKKTTGSSGGGKGGGTKTGDTSDLILWSQITAAGALMFLVMLAVRRRNGEKDM